MGQVGEALAAGKHAFVLFAVDRLQGEKNSVGIKAACPISRFHPHASLHGGSRLRR